MKGLVWIIVPIAIVQSGCAQIPIPRANAAPIHIPPPQPPSTGPDSAGVPVTRVSMDERALLPPLPPELREVPAPSNPLATTATLDEAVAQTNLELPAEAPPDPNSHPVPPPDQVQEFPKAEEPPATATALKVEPEQTPLPDAPTSNSSKPEPASASPTLLAAADPRPTTSPAAIDPEKPVAAVDPEELWTEGFQRLRKLAGEQDRAAGDPPSGWRRRLRLLELLEVEETQSEHDESLFWTPILAALADHREASSGDFHSRALKLRAAVDALEEQAPLEIGDLRLCRKVKGFGNYELIDLAAWKSGQPLIVYCEMAGVRYIATGDMCHSKLSARVELVTADGGTPTWSQDLGAAEDVCRHRRRDYYVNYRIILPENLVPGSYTLRVTQTDELAGRSTSSSIPLTIRP